MRKVSQASIIRTFHRFSDVSAYAAIVAGVIVLLGWWLDVRAVILVRPSLATTAIIFAVVLWTGALGLNRANVTRSRAEKRDLLRAALVESASDAVVSSSLTGVITSWNHGAEILYGYREEEVLGKTAQYLLPEDRKQEVQGVLRHMREKQTVLRFETVRRRKDESLITVAFTVFPVRKRDGTLIGVASVARDITEQKRSEEGLRQSQAQLKSIIDSAMNAVITVDRDQQVVMFNAAAEKMFLCSAAEALGSPLERFIPERFRQKHLAHMTNFGENRIARRDPLGVLTGLRTNGEEFPLEISISKTESDGTTLFTAIMRDVSERVLAEKSMRLAQARLVSALEGGRMGTWVWDIANNKIDWDTAMGGLFGRTPEELASGSIEPFFSWIHPENQERAREDIAKALSEGMNYDSEYRLFRPDRSVIWISSRGKVERDAEGKPFRMTGICTDITERKKMEQQLLQSQKMEALGTLAGGIAHDFNNILLAIGGNARLAIEEVPPEHPAQQSLREIAKAGTRASSLVRQILAFSRRRAADRKPIAVQPVVEEALALLRATLPARIQICTGFSPDLPAISADSTQLHQVIMNLGTNAARAMGEYGGTLAVTARQVIVTPETVDIAKVRAGNYVRLSVSDDGCGMDVSVMERIFDPFFTTQPVGQGTGLGLSVVHGIMKDHEGSIMVYSEPGKGTVFHLYFPTAGAVADQAVTRPAAAPQGNGEHLLFVDDEESLVYLAERSLGRLGYNVSGFTDPVLALKAFAENPAQFGAVVTDLSMPGLSGGELARKLIAIRPDIPIVMTSGYIRPEDELEARTIGVRDLILKPDSIDELAKSLHRVFAGTPAGVSITQ